jgi:hypothetical protein
MYLLLCCKRHMSLTYLIRLTHLSLYNTFVCMTLFCLKVHFVWYWYSNSAVFWLLFAWYIFFYSFTVNLSLNLNVSQGWGCNSVVSSYLACMRPSVWSPVPQTNKIKYVSCRKHFSLPTVNLCLFFLAVLGIEFTARQSLHHLSHVPIPVFAFLLDYIIHVCSM